MRFLLLFITLILMLEPLTAQRKMDRVLRRLNSETVPYVQVASAAGQEGTLFLDARKYEEFAVSHIKNAQWVGHRNFDPGSVRREIPDDSTKIIVYCSIGVRSERVGEKLMKMGYSNVNNLYGGIFEWKNQGFPVYDARDSVTERVHAFNRHWGKLLQKGVKVYDVEKE